MDQFNFNSFPETNFNEVNLSWMLEVMSKFKEDIESGQFVGPQGPQGPQGETGPAGDGISEAVKEALLQLVRKVAYIDAGGQTYYQDLYDALYGTTPAELVSISAAYTQTGTVYDTDSLESLKADLIVTATYSDSSTAVIPAADYTLSGSLTAGTSTITVSYSGKTATFNVTVTASAVTLVSISAAFNQGSAVIYESDSLDSLKQYLTVTATYSDSTTATIPSTDYTLSGTLTEGSSTITVSYRGKTDTFQVTVTASAVTLVSISAAFNQGSAVIYDSDSLDSLKQYLTVTATYSDSTTATIPSTDYTLSGTLTAGTSTITVSYGGKTTTFTVVVMAQPVQMLYNWDFTQSLVDTVQEVELTSANNRAPSRDSSGLHYTASLQQVTLPVSIDFSGKTLEIDVASMSFAGNSSYHIRFVCLIASQQNTTGRGVLIYHKDNKYWAAYGNTSATGSSANWSSSWGEDFTGSSSDVVNIFSGKTVKIVFHSDGHTMDIYLDNVYKGTLTSIYFGNTEMRYLEIGGMEVGTVSAGNQFYNTTLTGMRIYSNE